MRAIFSTTGLMQQRIMLLVVFSLPFFFAQHAAHAATADKIAGANRKTEMLRLSADPYALQASAGKRIVRFSVPVQMALSRKSKATVFLRRRGDKQIIAMNDRGIKGDYVAKDGIYGANVQIDTTRIKPDSCLYYEAYVKQERTEVFSRSLRFCVSSFPVHTATPNVDKPVVLDDGIKVVADEVLIHAKPTTSAATIRELAGGLNARVVGTIPPLYLYQLRLPSPVSAQRLLEIVAKLNASAEIAGASVNPIGQAAGHVDNTTDPEFANQHGVKLVSRHPTLADTYVWDADAIGTGVTVVVADEGLDRRHPEFGILNDCQVTDNNCGPAATNDDNPAAGYRQWHGTRVAGVIAAKANNTQGIAGVAHGSVIRPHKVPGFTLTDMQQVFTDVSSYVPAGASVINASFSGGPWTGWAFAAGIGNLCTAVNNAVSAGYGAIAVIAAGNNGADNWYYPARCNQHANVTAANRGRVIVVGNSTSVVTPNCGSVGLEQRCAAAVPSNPDLPGSNYGAWVDIMAPGSDIRTTTSVGTGDGAGNNYTYSTGTSFSTPMVSGAVAVLKSCGVALDSIKSTLIGSATVNVPYPASGSATTTPRVDVYLALRQHNHSPANITLSSNSVSENADTSGGVEIGVLSVTDADTCDRHVLSVGGADGALFNVDAATNTLRLNPGVVLNYGVKPSYSVTVRATDFFDAFTDQTFTVSVVHVNVPPTATNMNAAQSYTEDTPLQLMPIVVSDPDTGDTIIATLTLSNAGAGSLSTATSGMTTSTYDVVTGIWRAAGSLAEVNALLAGVTFTPAPNYNGNFSIATSVSDGSPLPSLGSKVLTGLAVNDAPTGSDASITIDEDMPRTFSAADFGFNDLADSPADNLSGIVIVSVPPNGQGQLTLNGTTVTAGQPIANLSNLTFTPQPNASGSPYTSFTFQVRDDGGMANNGANIDPTPNTLTINVISQEDPLTGPVSIDPAVPALPAIRHVGDVLTANTGSLQDGDCPSISNNPGTSSGLCPMTGNSCSFGYQWMSSSTLGGVPTPISGATDSSYTLRNSDVGQFMSLCVSTGSGAACTQQCSSNDATAVGDPHITTVDGLHYDFQGAGEFVALRGAGGMEIQLRMAAVSTAPPLPDPYTGLTSGVSVNTAVAARVGQHRVTYQPDTSPNAAGAFVLRVDGVPTALPAGGIDLGDGGRVLSQAGGIQIDFPDQTTLMVNASSLPFYGAHWLHVSVFHTPAYEGLMGARSKGSWLPRLSNGSALGSKPASLHDRYSELYVKFADSWRVNKDTSLFDYVDGTSTATYTNKAWPTENGPYATGAGPVAQPLPRQAAELACRDIVGKIEKADCVFDVRVMGHKALAKGHLLHQQIRLGAVNVVVRPADKLNARDELVVTATVARHATVVPKVKGVRAVPAGTVQFMLGDKPLGKPVRLDARGQAKLVVTRQDLERFNAGKLAISARYLPAKVKGNVFLPGTSLKRFNLVKPMGVVKPIARPDLPGPIKRSLPLK